MGCVGIYSRIKADKPDFLHLPNNLESLYVTGKPQMTHKKLERFDMKIIKIALRSKLKFITLMKPIFIF